MIIRTGWHVEIHGTLYRIGGYVTIRRICRYLLTDTHTGRKSAIRRDDLLAGIHDGSVRLTA